MQLKPASQIALALVTASAFLVNLTSETRAGEPEGRVIHYRGRDDLQAVLEKAPPYSTVVCELDHHLEITSPIRITRPLTLKGLKAKLPENLRKTQILWVEAPNVRITEADLRGNYETVGSGRGRVPLIRILNGPFQVDKCTFYHASKDGVMITPGKGSGDIVGGVVRDIQAFGIGRDAVSIAGGNRGQRVVNVSVDNVRLRGGHKRGAVEVSDGTDNITVRNVYAEDAVYAIDIQDHGRGSAPNRNIVIQDVEAVNCKYAVRMANSDRGHANLVLRNVVARGCQLPVELSHTRNVTLDGLTVVDETPRSAPAVKILNCHGVMCRNMDVKGIQKGVDVVQARGTSQLQVEGAERQ